MTTAAAIILQQIKALDGMALFDWGALRYQPEAINGGSTLRLKSSGYVPWKGFIEITLDEGADLYNIEFYRIRCPRRTKNNPLPIPEKKVDSTLEGVFVDQLVEIIDHQVLKI